MVATIFFNADNKKIVQFISDTPSYGIITIRRDSSPITEKIFFNRSTSRILQTDRVVGTGSIRRRSFLHRLYPLVTVKDIRGNVDTRLRKLMNGEYDALILEAAGLERLGIYNSKEYTFT